MEIMNRVGAHICARGIGSRIVTEIRIIGTIYVETIGRSSECRMGMIMKGNLTSVGTNKKRSIRFD